MASKVWNEEFAEKITKAFEDKDFVAKISAAQDVSTVQIAFAEKGMNLSVDELGEVMSDLKELAATESGELPDDFAEQVAGGGAFDTLKNVLGALSMLNEVLEPLDKVIAGIEKMVNAFKGVKSEKK